MSDQIAALEHDLRLAKEKIASLETQLQNSPANGDDASAVLRHRLRTPLNTVLGLAQLLKSSPIGDSEPVGQMLNAATRMAELIEETPTDDANGRDPSAGTVEQSARHASSEAAGFSVLYIEDNALNCRLVARILSQRPAINLIFATLGAEGLEIAREWQPHLILLDLNLPDMHGSDVLRSLREDARTDKIPVVVISADATGTQIDR
ncbi:MAG: response regulator, partial [Chthoniobacterales bacterium]